MLDEAKTGTAQQDDTGHQEVEQLEEWAFHSGSKVEDALYKNKCMILGYRTGFCHFDGETRLIPPKWLKWAKKEVERNVPPLSVSR
ncbi:hypothetical protein GCM10028803_17510 [Larkinella knui]